MSLDSDISHPGDGRLDVAVIGMSGRFPDARTVGEYWSHLLDGRNCIRVFTTDELDARGVPKHLTRDPMFVPVAPILPDHPGAFDAEFFGFPAREAALLDPQHRLFLECAWEALESAGYAAAGERGSVGVYASSSLSAYLLFNLLNQPELLDQTEAARIMFGNDKDFLSTRVSYELDLHGPSLSIQTACSSSLVAIHVACQALITHECDMALAGGVSVHMPQRTGYRFVEGGYNSRDGYCRPFDARAEGTVFGSGAGVVVLKRLNEAVATGDTVLAVIRGSAINNDGSSKLGFTAPSIAGQVDVITRAHQLSEVEPDTIDYVETHGTATDLGDLVEVSALRQVFSGVSRRGACALGSVKSNIGHLDAASGVAGFIKAALAVYHGVIPATLHFETPNPRLALDDSPFYVPAQLARWPDGPHHRRRAGVSSFGIGGTNAHVVIEQPPPASLPAPSRSPFVLAVSARTPAALDEAWARLGHHVEHHADLNLGDMSFTLLTGRKSFPFRRVATCRDRESALECFQGASRTTDGEAAVAARPVTFLFPGAGAQYPGMGEEIYRSEAVFRDALDQCAFLLRSALDIDIRRLLFPAEADRAEATRRLQEVRFGLPVLLSFEYALARQWMSWGVTPAAQLGHSLGEYTAAILAGVMSLEDGLALVTHRAALLARLPPGRMLGVPLGAEEIGTLLDDDLYVSAINAPAQCVVSGEADAIERLTTRLNGHGIEFRHLHIHAAGHSPLVDPILAEFADRVAGVALHAPMIPYVSGTTGEWIRDDEARDPAYWVRHLREPVHLSRAVATLLGESRQLLIEVGPGHGLGSLVKRNVGPDAARALSVFTSVPAALDQHSSMETLVGSAAGMWVAGGAVDWGAFFARERRGRVPLPTYPFERTTHWVEQVTSGAPRRSLPGAKTPNVEDWFYTPTWVCEHAPSPGRDIPPHNWLVLSDEHGVADALRTVLAGRGVPVVMANVGERFEERAPDHFALRAEVLDDYREVLRRLGARGAVPRTIVHAWTLGLTDSECVRRRGFESLLCLARAMDGEYPGGSATIQFVSEGMFDASGVDSVCLEKAMCAAPGLVIPQEYPNLRCQCIDIGAVDVRTCDHIAEAILAEGAGSTRPTKIAYRGRRRWVERFIPRAVPEAGRPVLAPESVFWITGGLGRVGLRVARYLAARVERPRIVLITRGAGTSGRKWSSPDECTSAPSVVRQRCREMEDSGAQVWIAGADVTDQSALDVLAEETHRRFGRIAGIFHAAGVSGRSTVVSIADMTRDECDRQFSAKTEGIRTLAHVADRVRPDFCVVMSSNVSVLGGLGSIAYTAAHQYQDAFVEAHDDVSGVRWRSINWDGWPDHDDGLTVGNVRTSLDRYVMTPEECARALDIVLRDQPASRVVVSTGDLEERLKAWVMRAEEPARHRVVRSPAATAPAPGTELERVIVSLWEDVLGATHVGLDDNFFDLGGNSLIALKLVSRLTQLTGTQVALASIFEGPTPRALAAVLETGGVSKLEHSQARGESRRRRREGRVMPVERSNLS